MWLAIEGHDTANYERAQFKRVPTSELVGFSRLRVLVTMTIWTRVVLLVGGARGARLEQVAPDMVPGVLAALVALGAVALTALPARLGCTSVAAEGRPESGDEGLMEHC